MVLGDEDDAHRRDVAAIRERFEPKGWEVQPFKIRSRPSSGTYVPEPPPKKTPARLRADGLAALRAPPRHRDGEGRALLPGLLREADRRGPEDADGRGDARAARRWRACAAGPTASRRRRRTSSAAAASSRSESEDRTHDRSSRRPRRAACRRPHPKIYRLYDRRPAARARLPAAAATASSTRSPTSRSSCRGAGALGRDRRERRGQVDAAEDRRGHDARRPPGRSSAAAPSPRSSSSAWASIPSSPAARTPA